MQTKLITQSQENNAEQTKPSKQSQVDKVAKIKLRRHNQESKAKSAMLSKRKLRN